MSLIYARVIGCLLGISPLDEIPAGATTVVAIFPYLCLWRRSLCSNLGGIDPEKLYRATSHNHRRSKRFHWDRSLVKKPHWNEFLIFVHNLAAKDFIQLKIPQLGRSNWFNRCLRTFGSLS